MIEISALRLRDGEAFLDLLRSRGIDALIADGTRVSARADVEHAPHILHEFSRAVRELGS